MSYVFAVLFWWIVAALIVGLIVGWFTWSRDKSAGWMSGWLKWALVAFIVGLVLAWLTVFPGRVGFWLESALFFFASYIVGCVLASWLKGMLAGNEVPAAAATATAATGLMSAKTASTPATSTPTPVAKPAVAPVAAAAGHAGTKPVGIAAAEGGKGDDLKVIKGIGPKNEKILNDLGVFHWCQIAAWTPENAVWMGHHMAFPGRIEREHWISQAHILCAGGDTEHSLAVKSGAIKADDAPMSDADLAKQKAELDAKAKAAADKAAADKAAVAAKAASDKAAADKAASDKVAADKVAAENAAAKAKADADAKAAAAKTSATKTSAAPASVSGGHAGTKPVGIAAPEGGKADDLKVIDGIGPKNEKILHDLGVFHFCQIAAWTPENAEWMGHHMAFPGRIEREGWIAQANVLCAGGTPGKSAADLAAEAQAIADAANAAAPLPDEDKHAGKRPPGLKTARGGKADDLKLIKGIGPQNEGRLHGLGIWHFDQIAAWSHDQVLWVGSYLAFPGRIDREGWIAQAKELAAGKMTEFAKRAAAGEVPTSKDDGSKGAKNVDKV